MRTSGFPNANPPRGVAVLDPQAAFAILTSSLEPGFSNTDLGGDLYRYGKEWDQRAYAPATLAQPENKDGLFDFKLNIGNDAFTTPPTLYTGPDRN